MEWIVLAWTDKVQPQYHQDKHERDDPRVLETHALAAVEEALGLSPLRRSRGFLSGGRARRRQLMQMGEVRRRQCGRTRVSSRVSAQVGALPSSRLRPASRRAVEALCLGREDR